MAVVVVGDQVPGLESAFLEGPGQVFIVRKNFSRVPPVTAKAVRLGLQGADFPPEALVLGERGFPALLEIGRQRPSTAALRRSWRLASDENPAGLFFRQNRKGDTHAGNET